MSRHGYIDDGDLERWDVIRWRGAVESAIRGRRGQAFLREMLDALDALPQKRLVVEELLAEDGSVCAIGALGLKRGVDLAAIDPDDPEQVAVAFGVAPALVRELTYINDEGEFFYASTPEARFVAVHGREVTWIQLS